MGVILMSPISTQLGWGRGDRLWGVSFRRSHGLKRGPGQHGRASHPTGAATAKPGESWGPTHLPAGVAAVHRSDLVDMKWCSQSACTAVFAHTARSGLTALLQRGLCPVHLPGSPHMSPASAWQGSSNRSPRMVAQNSRSTSAHGSGGQKSCIEGAAERVRPWLL